jgi:hypothetical protein
MYFALGLINRDTLVYLIICLYYGLTTTINET